LKSLGGLFAHNDFVLRRSRAVRIPRFARCTRTAPTIRRTARATLCHARGAVRAHLDEHDRVFVPARLEDNPHLDRQEYELFLAELDPLTRAQLRHGDWKVHAGGRFNPRWCRYRDCGDHYLLEDDVRPVARAYLPRLAVCDPANRKTKASKYTAAGVFGDAGRQRLLVLDMLRQQLAVEEIVPALHTLCGRWAPVSWLGIEANGFQIALANEARDRRRYPAIPTVLEMDPQGKSKLTRATPAIIRAERGRIYLPEEAPWKDDFVAELGMFTGDDKLDGYTDQCDVLAYAVLGLDRFGSGRGDAEPELLGRGYRRR
jgi:predicted phage terminase large subunit-like protein